MTEEICPRCKKPATDLIECLNCKTIFCTDFCIGHPTATVTEMHEYCPECKSENVKAKSDID